jgi:ParB-like chromosome segregation protein Spo0J
MIRQIEIKSIPVDLIKVGHRYRQPSETEIDEMLRSIQQEGLLTPISVRGHGDDFRLVCGATRLAAAKKTGLASGRAELLEGTPEEFEIAEIVENLERRHLDKAQRDELTKKLVQLRSRAMQGDPVKELNDRLSRNSFKEPSTHPKTKIEGAKRGRPVTAEAKAKKEVAAQTGQSLRNVQRATSRKLEVAPTPKKKSVDRDSGRLGRMDAINHHIEEISKLLAACDRTDRDMIRRNNQPYLDGWFGPDGKLLPEVVVTQTCSADSESLALPLPKRTPEYAAA